MAQFFYYPPTSVTFSDPAEGAFGDPLPSEGIAVGAEDPSGDMQPLKVNASGELLVDVTGSFPDPLDVTIVGPLGQDTMAASIPVVIASDQSTIDVDVTASVLPTGAATELEQQAQTALLTTIGADAGTIAGAIGVEAAAPPAGLMLVGGVNAGATNAYTMQVDSDGHLQVDVQTSGLPTGAATLAEQQAQTALLTTIDTDTGAIATSTASIDSKVATETTLAAMSAKLPATLGQKTMANSLAVTMASDQSALAVAASNGMAKSNAPTYYAYASGNVTTAAYVQLIASTTSAAKLVEVFDSSGQALQFAVGAAASEVDQFIIVPGGNGAIPLSIPASSRISIKAVTGTASSGYITLNLFG